MLTACVRARRPGLVPVCKPVCVRCPKRRLPLARRRKIQRRGATAAAAVASPWRLPLPCALSSPTHRAHAHCAAAASARAATKSIFNAPISAGSVSVGGALATHARPRCRSGRPTAPACSRSCSSLAPCKAPRAAPIALSQGVRSAYPPPRVPSRVRQTAASTQYAAADMDGLPRADRERGLLRQQQRIERELGLAAWLCAWLAVDLVHARARLQSAGLGARRLRSWLGLVAPHRRMVLAAVRLVGRRKNSRSRSCPIQSFSSFSSSNATSLEGAARASESTPARARAPVG